MSENVAGRGKKLCQGCKKYVGVRTRNCECGYSFDNSLSLTDLKNSVSETKKLVEKVKATAAPAVSISVASVQATNEKDTNSLEAATTPAYLGKNGGVTCIPSGSPPVKPEGFKIGWPDGQASEEVVRNWANKIMEFGQGRFSYEVPIYWSRYFWDITSIEYKRVKSIIINTLIRPKEENEN